MIVYSGNELKKQIETIKKEIMAQTGLNAVYERDFVNDIRENYFNTDWQKVLVVSGLRATGKTFGLFQAVEKLDDTIYIQAQKEEPQTGRDYIEFLQGVKEKNIIIDEYSWIEENRDLSYYLWTLVENGKRVAITGTDSIALDYLGNGDLIHRVAYTNVNMFTYEEYCRIYQKPYKMETCNEYLENGGVFKEYAINEFNTMLDYIQTAVIDNLASYTNIPAEKARAIIYDIMYLSVCDSDVTTVQYPNGRKSDFNYQRMLSKVNINPSIEFDYFDFDRVSNILVKTGFVVKTYNIADYKQTKDFNKCGYRLHLVNPSLTYQMVKAVFDEPSVDNCRGKAFEANVVAFMTKNKNRADRVWYADMGRFEGEPELELIIVNPDDHLVYLFDAKLREAARLPNNSSLVSQKLEDLFEGGADIGGRFVVGNSKTEKCGERNGKKVIFTRLDCETLQNYRQFDESYERLSGGLGNGDDERKKPSKKFDMTDD